jgi:hypothetical protein
MLQQTFDTMALHVCTFDTMALHLSTFDTDFRFIIIVPSFSPRIHFTGVINVRNFGGMTVANRRLKYLEKKMPRNKFIPYKFYIYCTRFKPRIL